MAKDRYEKLMEDWDEDSSWTAPESGGDDDLSYDFADDDFGGDDFESEETAKTPPKAQFRARRHDRPPAFKNGTLVCLDEAELIVYRGPARGQSYDMVYALLADGTAKLEGCNLKDHHKFEMGRLQDDKFKLMQDHKRWTRKVVVEALFDAEDADIIPEPESDNSLADELLFTPPKVEEPPPEEAPCDDPGERGSLIVPINEPALGRTMQRGQRLVLRLGKTKWEAVYWGRDANGTVIAHRTNDNWELMHFDLGPYKRKVSIAEKVDNGVVKEIMSTL